MSLEILLYCACISNNYFNVLDLLFSSVEPLLEKPKKKVKTVANAFNSLFAPKKKASPKKEETESG